ncbi:LPS export ABC transporter permease LptG [Martelella alba]|uniref:LPS export ABC transporter permease LptG n=1 Tax=Martelella alba TaxID=2590451 RepID=A0A506UJA0_9HYPH|nr:LPS export ABC transporter permease LptG [Martelella alba]TPW33395.1 LPS export ABC transporter permease LptG [Martelella alba]
MLFSTLGRYFLRRYIITILWFFGGITSLILLINFSETVGSIGNNVDNGMLIALAVTALQLPAMLQQTIPFIALFASMVTLVALNRKYELVVTRAAGISVWQFMLPFVFGSFLLGLISVMGLSPLNAWSQPKAIQLQATASGTSNQDSKMVPWLRQRTGDQDTIIGGRQIIDGGTGLADAVVIYFDKNNRITLRQDAKMARLGDGWWTLSDVTEFRPGEISVHRDTARVQTNLEKEFVQQSLAQPEMVSFFDLPRKIDAAKQFGISTKGLETQYNYLLSLPILLIAMSLIAATVCLKFSRFAQSPVVIFGGILSGFLLYVVSVLVKAFGSSGVLPPILAAWIPVIVAMALGLTILLYQEDG